MMAERVLPVALVVRMLLLDGMVGAQPPERHLGLDNDSVLKVWDVLIRRCE